MWLKIVTAKQLFGKISNIKFEQNVLNGLGVPHKASSFTLQRTPKNETSHFRIELQKSVQSLKVSSIFSFTSKSQTIITCT
jgi:hypothetical protein